MFAAFQKASWNWVPVSVSEHLTSMRSQSEIERTLPEKEMILNHESAFSIKNEKWFEIPLSSDDEDHISPRGVLQFRKISCSETTGKESDNECDEHALSVGVASECQEEEMQQDSLWHERKQNDDTYDITIPQLPTIDPDTHVKYDTCPVIGRNDKLNCGDAEFQVQSQQNSEAKAIGPNENVEANVELQKGHMDQEIAGRETGKDEAKAVNVTIERCLSAKSTHDVKCGSDEGMRKLLNAETQTIGNREDFSSTKMALQRQLSDALSALDLTRNQANALRDRLRTYTSSMRQQAGDLRESSRSLNHALDKAMEYKTKWKNETKRRETVEKRLTELESEAKDSQKILASKTDEIKLSQNGLNELGRLLKCDDIFAMALQKKISHVSTTVRGLLELVERVQADACLANMQNVVEMKEFLEKYEEEKQKWEFSQKNSDAIFSIKLQEIETEKSLFQERVKNAEESNVELKNCYEQKMIEIENKNMRLQKCNKKEKDLEETISRMQKRMTSTLSALETSLQENQNLQHNFQYNTAKFNEEKRRLDDTIAMLQKKIHEMTTSKVESGVQCDLTNSGGRKHSESQSPLRSSSIDFKAENERLQSNVQYLEEYYTEMKNRYLYSRDEYDRLVGDYRHLNRTCHNQQVSVQHLRHENASLKASIKKLERTIVTPKARREESNSSDGSDKVSLSSNTVDDVPMENEAIEQSRSRNNSVTEVDSKLETIAESSDEGNKQIENANVTNTEIDSVKSVTPNTAIVRPYQHTSDTVSKFSTCGDNSTKSSCEFKRRNRRRSKSRSSCSSTRRSLKSVQSNRFSILPVWRRENPENQYSINSGSEKSSDSEDVFMKSFNLSSVHSNSTYDVDTLENTDAIHSFNSGGGKVKRLIGIPMQEDEFQQMLGQSMIDNPSSITYSYSNDMSCGEFSQSSINSPNLSLEDDDTNYLHSTLLFPSSRLSSLNSEPNSIDEILDIGVEEKDLHYFIKYRGVTFDAVAFNLTQMRQIAWEVGCSESESELNKFIDFLAEMADKLNDDPKWRGRHSLGKSSDWIGLKGLF